MANQFKDKFEKLIAKKSSEQYKFFTEHEIQIENRIWSYLEFNVDEEIYYNALEIAEIKSAYTMNANQNQEWRSDKTKLKKQAQGILAEIAVHLLFEKIYKISPLRFDLERENFNYNPNEYDLKLHVNNEIMEIEVRSSNARRQTIKDFIMNDVIIGSYGNSMKPQENLSDFHYRPMYFPEFTIDGNKPWENFKLYLFSCATKKEMETLGYNDNLGQYNTVYRVIKNKDADDMIIAKNKVLFNITLRLGIKLNIKDHDWKIRP
jgi:hypothetical protein